MGTHPAIIALEKEINKRHRNADQYQDSGLHSAAYSERREADVLKRAIAVIRPWLGGEDQL